MKRFTKLCLVTMGAVLLQACQSSATNSANGQGASGDQAQAMLVVASNYPLGYFATQLVGDAGRVTMPFDKDGDPAFWRPDAEAVLAMQQADLIVLNGAGYESWLTTVSLPGDRLVDTSTSFQDVYISRSDVSHRHGPEGEHSHGPIAFTTWLDPQLAIKQLQALSTAVQQRWTSEGQSVQQVADGLSQELNALDQAWQELAPQLQKWDIVYSHPVYQYFDRRYELQGRSVHWEPEVDPGAEAWAELDGMKADSAGAQRQLLFVWEAEPSAENKAQFSKRGIQTVVIDPCGNVPDEGDFLSRMQANVQAVRSCLQPQ